MAKKPKKASEEEAAPEGEAAPAKSKKKLLLFAAVGAVLLAGGGGGGYFFLNGKGGAEPEKMAKKPAAFLDVREMTLNLASEPNQDRPRFLKLKVALELKDQKLVADLQPLMPRVEDAFQVFVRELRASEIEGSGGVYRLREELLRRVNVAVHPAKVDAVLFKEMIVQ
jgi:flagellar protein FliL